MSELVSLDQNAAERISSLWKCEEIRVLLEQKGDSLHLPGGVDGLAHHISRLQEYLSPSYVPTDSDLIRVRIKTTGIVETKFVVEGVTFVVCDVGGQRSERRKWIQCFSKVDAIIYLVATNEYDTTLEESTGFNSMADSLQQFKVISSVFYSILFFKEVGSPFVHPLPLIQPRRLCGELHFIRFFPIFFFFLVLLVFFPLFFFPSPFILSLFLCLRSLSFQHKY
eukprot:TRINITY_DN8388_c0_g2_i15.p1 TRINITY_DN8388_c0_g2~~TRINITY_DN8388_c0_g2_i15.p1  ORF type:complete len:224 (-),score=31.59 TRINITY_DN8388_c0_g2_i15:3-674(-)